MPEYRDLILRKRNLPANERVDDALSFLGQWNALRFKGGEKKVRSIIPSWLSENEWILRRLDGRPLRSLAFADFSLVFYLSASLRQGGIPPTAFGKLLHFFLPETVLLWDEEIVRTRYDLDGDPYTFLTYQCYGWRLLDYLSNSPGAIPLVKIQQAHAEDIGYSGYSEPLPKLIDELAYTEPLRARAVAALGGFDIAFRLLPPEASISTLPLSH